jgi:hypothetical protein
MAEFSPKKCQGSVDDRVQVYEWQDANGDNTITVASDTIATAGLFIGKFREVAVQLVEDSSGTYAVEWHGTLALNNSDYLALTDARSDAVISQTGGSIDEVLQIVYSIRPSLATTTSGVVKLRVMCKY